MTKSYLGVSVWLSTHETQVETTRREPTLAHLGRLDQARDVFSRAQGQDPRYQKPPWIKPEDNTLRIEGIRLAAGEMK